MALRQSHIQGLNKGRNRRNEAFADVESVLDQLEHKLASSVLDGSDAASFSSIQTRLDGLERSSEHKNTPESFATTSANSDFSRALDNLKEELSSSFQKQFDIQLKTIQTDWLALAKDMRDQLHSTSSQDHSLEIQSLAQDVADLRSATLSIGTGSVDNEIQSLRSDLNNLAREDSLETLNRRWDTLEDHWQSLGAHLASKAATSDTSALAQQLAMIEERLHLLPSNTELNRVLDEIHALQQTVSQNGAVLDNNFPIHDINARLDEITRAIAASPVQHNDGDTQTIQKIANIDQVIQKLAQDVTALSESQHTQHDQITKLSEIETQLLALQNGLSNVSNHSSENSSNVAIERGLQALTQQVEATLTGSSETAARLADIETALSGMVQIHPSENGAALAGLPNVSAQVQELTQKIESAADQINSNIELAASQKRQVAIDPKSISSAIDGRLQAFLEEFRKNTALTSDSENTEEVVRALETGFNNISTRLDATTQHTTSHDETFAALATRLDAVTHLLQQPSTTTEIANDPANQIEFEAQLANLANRVNASIDSFATLSPRLENIERSLEVGKSETIEASRTAAENAIRNAWEGLQLDFPNGDNSGVLQLTQDIANLQELAKGNDSRNAKTFGAIHETLLKIVDRLEEIESRPAPSSKESNSDFSPQDPVFAEEQSTNFVSPPSLVADYSPTELGFDDEPISPNENAEYYGANKPKLSPLEAAKAAAKAALSDSNSDTLDQSAAQTFNQSLDAAKDAFEADSTDSYAGGQSSSPDLNSILKKVRNQRADGTGRVKQNGAPADLLASARRAAKAAASEAETVKTDADVKGRLGERDYGAMLTKAKRPLMLGAIGLVVVIAGLQLSSMMSGGGEEIDFNEPMALENTSPQTDPASLETMPALSQNDGFELPSIEPMDSSGTTTDFSPVMDNPTLEQSNDDASTAKETTNTIDINVTSSELESPIDTPELGFGTPALKTAVDNGDAQAFFEVGQRFAEGRGTPADLTKAAQWFEQSAELSFAPAQFRIGNFYEKGRGVTRDIFKAVAWYEKAGDQGNTAAMHNLAVLYADANAGVLDTGLAADWFARAAEYGLTDSQYNLAIMMATGKGLEKDLVQSYKWFAIAAQGGDAEAGKRRDEVANMISPEQLKEAQAHVDLWKAKPSIANANSFSPPEEWRVDVAQTASVDMRKAIMNIQLILKKNGYNPGTPDGVMGSKTKSAIKKFQQAEGLPQTGEINDALVKALLAKNS